MIKFMLATFLVLCLSGCSSLYEPKYNIERDFFVVKIVEDPELKTDGLAEWKQSYCKITLKKYPKCLLHEMRHCIEGDWHDEKPNGQDCGY